MAKLTFLRESMKRFKTIGSITPSSKFLIEKVLDPIDFSHAKCIVELGPGDGCITKAVLKQMRPQALLLSFETNREFCRILSRINDKRLVVINDSAERMEHYMEEYQMQPDYVISGLPFTLMPKQTRENVMRAVLSCLKPEGIYIQYQFSLQLYKKVKEMFDEVKVDFTLLNLPPAFVYTCRREQPLEVVHT